MKATRTKRTVRRNKPKAGPDRSPSRHFRFAVAIFLLAVLVRGMYLCDNSDNPTFRVPVVDSMTYDQMARKAVQGERITRDFFWQQCFYPSFLSVIYFFSNSSVILVKIIQILSGAVTCVLTFWLGDRIFGRTAGFLAACIAALYGPLIFFDGELLAACWGAFWAAVLICLFLTTAQKQSTVLCFFLGLCGALSIITRPNFLLFFAAGYIWLIVVWFRQRVRGGIFLSAGATTVGFLIVVLPVAVKNHTLTGRFSFLPATGAINLYIGNNPEFEAVSIRPGLKWKSIIDLPSEHGAQNFDQEQQFYTSKVLEYIRTEPMGFIKGIAHKTMEFFSSREMPGNIDVYLLANWSRFISLLMWKIGRFGFPFGLLLPLATLGLVLNRRAVPVPVILFVILYPATVILTHIEARYRIPIIIPMCILAGSALVEIGRTYRQKRWRRLIITGISGTVIAFLCSVSGPFCGEKTDYEPELYYAVADSLNKRGRPQESIIAYSKAVALKNDYIEAHHNLGLVLVDEGEIKEAIEHYKAAIKIYPEFASAHNDLGRAFYLLGENEKALEHHHKAIQIDPENADAYNDMGNVLSKVGRIDEAIEHYYKAVDLRPGDASSHNNLGNAIFKIGRMAEAIEHYHKALDSEPDNVSSHSNLGNVLAMSGRLTEAIDHYKASLANEPGNARVLSNLGNALLGLGKLQEAEARYNQSLKIEPDNARTYCNLGICLKQQGRIDEAIEAFNKALAIEPQHRRAREVLDGIQRE